MKPTRFRITPLHLLVAFLLAIFGYCASACRDVDALPAIEGDWRQTAPASPGWTYTFDNSIVTQRVKDFGATLSTLQFTYAQRGDTLYIGGDENNPPRLWLIHLLGDIDMKAYQRPADPAQREWDVLYFERL